MHQVRGSEMFAVTTWPQQQTSRMTPLVGSYYTQRNLHLSTADFVTANMLVTALQQHRRPNRWLSGIYLSTQLDCLRIWTLLMHELHLH
jgi:hypothetical protein